MKNFLIQLKYEINCLLLVDGTWEEDFHAKHNTSVEYR